MSAFDNAWTFLKQGEDPLGDALAANSGPQETPPTLQLPGMVNTADEPSLINQDQWLAAMNALSGNKDLTLQDHKYGDLWDKLGAYDMMMVGTNPGESPNFDSFAEEGSRGATNPWWATEEPPKMGDTGDWTMNALGHMAENPESVAHSQDPRHSWNRNRSPEPPEPDNSVSEGPDWRDER